MTASRQTRMDATGPTCVCVRERGEAESEWGTRLIGDVLNTMGLKGASTSTFNKLACCTKLINMQF